MIGAFIAIGDGPRSPGWIIDGNGCHIWTGSLNSDGYGQWRPEPTSHPTRWVKMHRWRYEREVGPVPDGLVLDHFVCDNRACCNPRHVRPVSVRENTLRGRSVTADKLGQTHCLRGHPLSGENLITRTDGRRCLVCTRAAGRKRQAKRRAALGVTSQRIVHPAHAKGVANG
jgi:hypothetical protein